MTDNSHVFGVFEETAADSAPQAHTVVDGARKAHQNFLDLLAAVDACHDLPVTKRTMVKTNIRTCARAIIAGSQRAKGDLRRVRGTDFVLKAIPCDVGWLNRHLFALPSKVAVGLDVKGFGNAVSGLRWALRHHDLLDPAAKALSADATAWHQLLKAVAATGSKYHFGLTGFAVWCHGRGIDPTSARDEMLLAFQHHLETRTLRADIPGLLSNRVEARRPFRAQSRPLGA
jgi:hypothetical protein